MGMAFGISGEDVVNVLLQQGVQVDDDAAQTLLDDHLNDGAIESAALQVTDFEEQTDAAYAEILSQLVAGGHVERLRAQQDGRHLEGTLPSAPTRPRTRM